MNEPKKKIIVDSENKEADTVLPEKEIDSEIEDEINSDGSGEAFEQTEQVKEDNFDDLKEK